jgi:hypothetical protein
VILEVRGEVWFWRGPAPWHFVTVGGEAAAAIEHASSAVTYGWGMIPVTCTLGGTSWTTSLWPKDGDYLIPLKAAVRTKERVELGDVVTVALELAAV